MTIEKLIEPPEKQRSNAEQAGRLLCKDTTGLLEKKLRTSALRTGAAQLPITAPSVLAFAGTCSAILALMSFANIVLKITRTRG